MQAEVEKHRVNAAGGHRTAFTRCSGRWPRTVPGDHCARAATDLRSPGVPADGRGLCLGTTAPGPQRICLSGPLTHAAVNSHTASRGNQLRETATAAISDMRHIRNRTGPYFKLRSYGRGQPQPPPAASL